MKTLNVTAIEPRYRHATIFTEFDALKEGDAFILVNDHDPVPLYYQLKSLNGENFSWDYLEKGPEIWKVRISRCANPIAPSMEKWLGHYSRKTAFNTQKFNPVMLAGNENIKVIQVCMKEGQFIPEHSPAVALFLYVIEGVVKVLAGNEEKLVTPGESVYIGAGERRGLLAMSDFIGLHIVSPPPTQEDHAEVMDGLKKNSWKK